MATVSDTADSVKDLNDRLIAVFKSHGWGEGIPLNSLQSYLPSYSFTFITDYISYTERQVRSLTDDHMSKPELAAFVSSIPTLVSALPVQQLANDPATTVSGLMMTLHMINSRLPTEPRGPIKLDWESVEDKSFFPKDLARRLRDVDNRLISLEPRSAEIDKKISDIEAAHETAEQLPEDLAELASKRAEVSKIVTQTEEIFERATKVGAKIDATSDAAADARQRMAASEKQAEKLIEKSEQALRGSTGVGLANAFEKRKEGLTWAGAAWVAGLVSALVSAFFIGANRVTALQAVLSNDSPSHIVWMNVVLVVFGIGGPIWFAWLSTKQIAVNFKLAEDYAFKAAVSKAYEGYRKEAIEIDPALQGRLFASALDRLEEAPIRLMEKETHSSPLQELLANPTIRKGLEGIPGIADKIIALIPEKGGMAAVVGSAAAVSSAMSTETMSAPKPRAKKSDDE
ncbi:hypothetical protein I3J13_03780 [Agrobacterium sp. MOPV5]|uniref:hypothetical protein n=1 Tax=Agrobacterium leguminum TaxID=2792015 RepID=UPI0018C2FE21|nr:hypothetical protein [Agrobacterium leguminum]MBG0507872.1 hypothetical protein [Agrobacterium leguminum]